ncbi:MAG: hypothetical protein ACJ8EL_18995 [Rhizomicrobium sp.]
MCNLYSITTNQVAIIAIVRVINRFVGNLPPMHGVFPDYLAPAVRNEGGEREMVLMRRGSSGTEERARGSRIDVAGRLTNLWPAWPHLLLP